jgi:ATP-dependent DNA helicase PIF1
MEAVSQPKPQSNDIELSPDQRCVFEAYARGENVFMTGPGGTGKSALIKYIVNDAKNKGKRIDVCALTGCASVLLECSAKTIHSWAGIGIAKESKSMIADKVSTNKLKKKNWLAAQVLIIDEVSMLSLKLFEALELIGRKCKVNQRPFGGIQVIFSGDFFQLPPVGNFDDPTSSQFCFESPKWNEVFPNQLKLTTMFRQKDALYAKILNQIREGKISRSSCDVLKKFVGRTVDENEYIKPTILFPKKRDAEKINKESLSALEGETKEYYIKDCDLEELNLTDIQKQKALFYSKQETEFEKKALISSLTTEEIVRLKKGAQVMSIANLDLDSEYPICNGSQGIVEDFDDRGFPIVKFRNGVIRTITPWKHASERIPSVAVKQIPLILAWAVTIHKSQGATLEIAEMDIGNNVFACGQTYVALSRVKNLDGLFLKSFNPYKIKVNLKVKKFYENMV